MESYMVNVKSYLDQQEAFERDHRGEWAVDFAVSLGFTKCYIRQVGAELGVPTCV